jgi:hypothetical protein
MERDPDPDPTLIFSEFKDAKKLFFKIFFVMRNLTRRNIILIFSVLKINFLLKFCVTIFLCKHYFTLLNTGSGSIPLTNGPGSGSERPNNMRILRIRIPNTGTVDTNQDSAPKP